jgi:PAS domain S-box-containing protein
MVFLKEAQNLNFVVFNRAGEELLGYQRKDLLGKNNLDLFPPEQAAFFMAKDREVLASGGMLDIPQEPIQTAHQGQRLLHTRKICLKGADGAPRYLLGISEDITAEVEARKEKDDLVERLRLSQKLESVGLLAGGIAHDFNNLLSVILGYTGFAISGLRPGDPMKGDLQEVQRAGERAAALTRQLLAFSRKQVLQPALLNLNAVVLGVEMMLRRTLGEDIDFVQVLAPDLGLTLADPGQIEQVLMNLVVNARDAMPRGGTLTIETSNVEMDEDAAAVHLSMRPGAFVLLVVTDTGLGMDPETKARIFEPFFTTKDQGKGTGLGLATVYGIVKQSGGTIWVYSELGQGTALKVYLPRAAAGAHAAIHPRVHLGAGRSSKGETILVVDDEEGLRKVARRSLEAAGYQVLTAADADEAVLLFARHQQDIALLLTDVVMPRTSGQVLAQRLSRAKPSLKIIYMSGYTNDAIIQHGVLDAGTNFLTKPFIADDLTRLVSQVLEAGTNEPART